jgi:hypothetical protein
MPVRNGAQFPIAWETEPPIERRRQRRIAYGAIRPENRVETRIQRRLHQQAMAQRLPHSARIRAIPEIDCVIAREPWMESRKTVPPMVPDGGNFFEWEKNLILRLFGEKDSRFRVRHHSKSSV